MPAFSSIISILASLSHYHRINNTWAGNRSPQEIPTICLQIWGQTSKALLYALRHSHSKHSKHLWAASMQASIPQMQQARASWSEMESSISFPPLPRASLLTLGKGCLSCLRNSLPLPYLSSSLDLQVANGLGELFSPMTWIACPSMTEWGESGKGELTYIWKQWIQIKEN